MFLKDSSIVGKNDFKIGTFFIEEQEYPLLHQYLQSKEAMEEFSKFKNALEARRVKKTKLI